ncbi:MAG: hypothetical protein IJV05_08405 [Muribaculaceae bacterium]|nr:hypothetical protein [Muribaculaceae bacterium]
MKHKVIWLIAGLIISVLFIVFSAQVYEYLYYEQEFSEWMFEQNLYLRLSLFIVIIAWAMAAIFYYGLSLLFVNFSRWYHWLIMLIVTVSLAPGVAFYYLNGQTIEEALEFSIQCQAISTINVALTAVFFIIASYSMRWWSRNAAYTPIPQ